MDSIRGSALAALLIRITKQFADYYSPGLGDLIIAILLALVLLYKALRLPERVCNLYTQGNILQPVVDL